MMCVHACRHTCGGKRLRLEASSPLNMGSRDRTPVLKFSETHLYSLDSTSLVFFIVV